MKAGTVESVTTCGLGHTPRAGIKLLFLNDPNYTRLLTQYLYIFNTWLTPF